MELGAGVGLTSIVTALFAKQVFCTGELSANNITLPVPVIPQANKYLITVLSILCSFSAVGLRWPYRSVIGFKDCEITKSNCFFRCP